ncbi:DUF177 domain-containing protein [Pseudodesulfovibrio piezophilus]|uniref:DUF177 domain-containing protein n=1 Tax=Pseudodesulfovibrio piezophilus (strain DSM 21447 / JCM 15486 / C1TLV30) TaxID=1322246 RepID=M1WQA3_PSEP2|nr:DUF177 domain-containing protein [Pseudodesulfovibrio piezophilus]CCH48849.1 conserved protein of unknown function [Pseudodesulfovibrio piezophilus C1TLV30]
MPDQWIAMSDISAEGREMTFDDQSLWHEGWKEFSIDVQPCEDLVAQVFILPQGENAALVRGTLKGSVRMACDRCIESFTLPIETTFDSYEALPEEEDDEEPRVRTESGQLQLNIGAILWEEFAIILPVKPLCSDGCKGMCPKCGKDLNKEACACEQDEGDERLAVFRNLKIK